MSNYLEPIFADANNLLGKHTGHEVHAIEYALMAIATGLAFASWFFARKWYKSDETWATPRNLVKNFPTAYKMLWEKWYLDQMYYKGIVDPVLNTSRNILWKFVDVRVIDGIVNGSARVVEFFANVIRALQSGVTQSYAGLMVLGIIVIIILMAW
jgi:NADH-quinone oxidoreductase subunit L